MSNSRVTGHQEDPQQIGTPTCSFFQLVINHAEEAQEQHEISITRRCQIQESPDIKKIPNKLERLPFSRTKVYVNFGRMGIMWVLPG